MSYYELNFALMQHHKYSLTELENMIPWERDLRWFVNKLFERGIRKDSRGES